MHVGHIRREGNTLSTVTCVFVSVPSRMFYPLPCAECDTGERAATPNASVLSSSSPSLPVLSAHQPPPPIYPAHMPLSPFLYRPLLHAHTHLPSLSPCLALRSHSGWLQHTHTHTHTGFYVLLQCVKGMQLKAK